ncbi:MAG: thermonuclease family protein [Rhodobacteraceae bacterium]|nr:thermonuclease family protein [Paracoccaceae bacterium]
MSLRPFVVPVVLIAAAASAVAFLLLAEPPAPPQEQPKIQAAAETPVHDNSDGSTAEDISGEQSQTADGSQGDQKPSTSAAPLPETIRDVSPDGIIRPEVTGPLVRVAPSEEYLERLKPVQVKTDGKVKFRRPEILQVGLMKTQRLTIQLTGIIPFDPTSECATQSGIAWPCGARAKTAFQSLIRQFRITCRKTNELGTNEIEASCRKGRISLSEWLLRYGWVDPAPGAPDKYMKLAARAKERKLGRWREDWQAPAPLEPVADTPLVNGLPLEQLISEDLAKSLADPGLPETILEPQFQEIEPRDLPPIE